jgi:aromatic ring-cleaving dioxygenase
LLDRKGVDGIAERHGKSLFDRADIDRVSEFQHILKERFAVDLAALQASKMGPRRNT